jgi:hypothetical protein
MPTRHHEVGNADGCDRVVEHDWGGVAFHLSSGLGVVVNAVAACIGAAFGLAFGAVLVNVVCALWAQYARR